jgi:Tol biopolymer transport system component
VVILDFGLVAELDGMRSISEAQGHAIVGTAAYMAPEQAKGRVVDKRADIWAFGCVLYEMLTGRRAFEGDDVSDTLASILKSEADWTSVPPPARRLLKKCLEKDPRKRLHDIGDAWDLLDDQATRVDGAPSRSSWLPWTLAALLLVTTIALVAMRFMQPAVTPSSARFQIEAPQNYNFETYVALSPDGKRVAFTAADNRREVTLWVRDLESLQARQLPGTELASSPFWSPDSRYLGFAAGRTLKKIDVSGGSPQVLADAGGNVGVGSWSDDGVIVFGTRGQGGIKRVAATGGPITDVTKIDPSRGDTIHSFPFFLPDGHRFLYWRLTGRVESQGVYVGSIDKPASEQDNIMLVPSTIGPVAATFGPDGDRLLFLRDGTLVAQPFDSSTAQVSGEPVPIAEQISSTGSFGFFSATRDVVVYRTGFAAQFTNLQLTWFGRKGEKLGTVGEPMPLSTGTGAIAISPNDRQAAVMMLAQSVNSDLWIVELVRGIASRFTFTDVSESGPVWSSDGSRIAFRTSRDAAFDLFAKDVNGTADEAALTTPRSPGIPSDWSPDGRFLLFSRFNGPTDADLFVLPFDTKVPMPILQTQFAEQNARISPDGRTIAYLSNESGAVEVYLRPFTVDGGKPSLGGKWRVSTDGGTSINWRGDGKELFYRNRAAALMVVDVVATGGVLETGNPRQLFVPPDNTGTWDVTSDGQRFLLSVPASPRQNEQRTPDPMTVVLNWQTAMQKK